MKLAFGVCLVLLDPSRNLSVRRPLKRFGNERSVAKAGRDRLLAVENVLTTYLYRGKREHVVLHVFPDRYWGYSDDRPTVFGISISSGNAQGRWRDSTTAGTKGGDPVWIPAHPSLLNGLRHTEIVFLLEPRWHKPKLVDLTSERIGRVEYHAVTVEVTAARIMYYIDKATNLVRRVRAISRQR